MTKAIKNISIVLFAALAICILAALPTKAAHAESERPVRYLSLSADSANLTVGQSKGLAVTYAPANTTDPKVVSWKSSNNSVATVSKGLIKAKKAGKVTITAKMGDETDTCTITVKQVAPKFVSASACYTQLNKYRKSAKVKNVSRNAKLEKIAQTRCKEIVKKFSHTRPNGKSGLTLISGNVHKGENIAKGQKSCAEVSKAWYKSTGHRKNMLRKQFKKVGIAGYQYNGTIYWVQVFSS